MEDKSEVSASASGPGKGMREGGKEGKRGRTEGGKEGIKRGGKEGERGGWEGGKIVKEHHHREI